MRYSNELPIAPETPVAASATNLDFFASVQRSVSEGQLACAVLLVGGSDERALAVRRAQAVLRYDRLTSYWSHAGLLLGESSGALRGVEVTLDPGDFRAQSPSRNGATVFSIERYADATRYPNLAVFCFEFPRRSSARETIASAAVDPNRERTRYPFWDQLATWARYAYAPDATPNPLLEGVALPAAAYCEYAFGTANIDLTPGATGNHACPEVLWATMKRWGGALDAMQSIKVHGFTIVRDQSGTPAKPLPSLAAELGSAFPGDAPPSDPGKARGKPSRAKKAKRR